MGRSEVAICCLAESNIAGRDMAERLWLVQAGGATSSGPAAGSGYEIILQAFNWESWREAWYKVRLLAVSHCLSGCLKFLRMALRGELDIRCFGHQRHTILLPTLKQCHVCCLHDAFCWLQRFSSVQEPQVCLLYLKANSEQPCMHYR